MKTITLSLFIALFSFSVMADGFVPSSDGGSVSGLSLKGTYITPQTFGAVGNEITITNCTFASGTSNLTTTPGVTQFFPSDVGKNVEAFGIGAGGQFVAVASVITNYLNTTNVMLAVASTANISGTRVDYGNDDTAAFTAAAAASASNGLPVLVPPARYFIDGNFTSLPYMASTASFSQIVLPFYSLETNTMTAVSFIGTQAIAYNNNNIQGEAQPMSTNGAILISSRAPSQSTDHTMLGIPEATSDNWGFDAITLDIENLTFRTYNGPTTTPLDEGFVGQIIVKNVEIDSGTPGTYLTSPTDQHTYGLTAPKANNWANTRLDNILVYGYACAYNLSEHIDANQLNATLCRTAVEFPGGFHAIHISRICTQECQNGFFFSGIYSTHPQQAVAIDEWDYENASDSGNLSWANTVNSIFDAGAYACGIIGYHGVTAGVGWAPTPVGITGTGSTLTIYNLQTGQTFTPFICPTNAIFSKGITVTANITNGSLFYVGQVINTNLQDGNLYVNNYGSTIQVSASVVWTMTGVAGSVNESLWILNNRTNPSAANTLITSLAVTQTNAPLSGVVPAGATYGFTNLSAGAGDSAKIIGGQIVIY